MKIKHLILGLAAACIFSIQLSAEENNPLSFGITTDFAYYPKSAFIAGPSHFAPITGAYSGVEGRVTGNLNYKIATPFGEHWLVKDANITLGAKLEVSPVSLKPGLTVSFTPLPFLVFSTGVEAGSGWNLLGIKGMAYLTTDNNGKLVYNDYAPFTCYLVKWYGQGTFQFDTGALVKGDWTHVQLMYTYQIYYEALTNAKKGDIWMWQATGNKANGWSDYQSLILAYQMPLVLSRIGVLAEFEGHYSNLDYTPENGLNPYSEFNGAFKKISISPLMQFSFGEHDTLAVLFGFSSRRSFVENHTETINEPYLTFAGREWFFNRVALSWTHNF